MGKNVWKFISIGIAIGVVLVMIIIFGFNGTPTSINIGGVDFGFPTPTPDIANIAGTWNGTGTVNLSNGVYNATMTLTISGNCLKGQVCGQGFVPDISCTFSLIYQEKKDEKFYFSEQSISGNCGIVVEAYLEPLSNNRLLYYAKGDWGETNLIMERKK
jgi:hypothetical protein